MEVLLTCDEVRTRLIELPPLRHGELEPHLAGCPDCRKVAERIRQAMADLEAAGVDDIPGDDPPPGLRPRSGVIGNLAATRSRGRPNASVIGHRAWPWLAILVLVLVMGPRLADRLETLGSAPTSTSTPSAAIEPVAPTANRASAPQVASVPPSSPAKAGAGGAAIQALMREQGSMVQAPSLVPPRTTVWLDVRAPEARRYDVCVQGPGVTGPLWSGVVGTEGLRVPFDGFGMSRAGRFLFLLSLGGDGSCGQPVADIALDVPP